VRLRVLPDCVSGTLVQGWLRAKVLASASHSTDEAETQTGAACATQGDISIDAQTQAIDAVLFQLAKTASLQGARVNVCLADAFVHFDVVEGDFAGDSDRQLDSVAVACVAELLGEAAQSHEIRWQLQTDGRHLLIGAIARAQLGALADAALRHGMLLGSVQSDFCLQWNCHAAASKPGSAVFAVACGHQAVITHVLDGAVAAISSGPWLDRHDEPGDSSADVKHLTSGLGRKPSMTAAVLDTRVDRLLASLGLNAAHPTAFLLVAPALPDKAVSSRWTILSPEEDAA
jgi:hypothetical protein